MNNPNPMYRAMTLGDWLFLAGLAACTFLF